MSQEGQMSSTNEVIISFSIVTAKLHTFTKYKDWGLPWSLEGAQRGQERTH